MTVTLTDKECLSIVILTTVATVVAMRILIATESLVPSKENPSLSLCFRGQNKMNETLLRSISSRTAIG